MIVSSVILENTIQYQFRKIRYCHTDHLAREHINSTTLNVGDNLRDYLDLSAANMNQQLISKEASDVLDIIEAGGTLPSLEFAEVSEVRALSVKRKAALEASVADMTTRKTRLIAEVV